MLTLSKPDVASPPSIPLRLGVALVPVASGRWRVIDPKGRVIGHLDAVATASGTRYSARRYHVPSRSFRELGEFWSAADAVECLRLSR